MTSADTEKLLLFYVGRKDLKRRFLVVNVGGHGKKDGTYPGSGEKWIDYTFLA